MRNHLLTALAIHVGISTACTSSGDSARDAVQRTDSAGVTIVRNSEAMWKSGEEWTLSREPVVEIGAQGSDTLHQFVGLISVTRLSTGELVVADRRPYQVRVFDSAGKYLRHIGREGQGPGEYQYITRVLRLGADSLLVATELGLNSIFSAEGVFSRSMRLERAPRDYAEFAATPWARDAFSDGSVLMLASVSNAPGSQRQDGVKIDSLEFNRYSPEGTRLNSLGVFDEYEIFVGGDDYYVRTATPERVFSVGGDMLYTGNGREFEIRVYEMDGALRRIVRIDTPAVRFTADSIARRREERLAAAQTPEARQRIERVYAMMDFPDSLPHFDNIVAADDGSVWVKRYTAIAARLWYVFDADGRWLGRVELPESFTLSGIAGDLVYGVGRDADDVEGVRVYGINKGGGGG